MAKEIVVWCDPCIGEEQRTPSREYRLAVGTVTKTVDLCEDHYKSLVRPVEALLEEYGAPVEVTGPKAVPPAAVGRRNVRADPERNLFHFEQSGTRMGRPVEGDRQTQCLWCPLTYVNDNSSGFGRHLQAVHGIEDRLRIFQGKCPVCGREDLTLMGAHLQKTHAEFGFGSITQAFIWARDNGDPHGAYAEVLTRAQR